MNERLRELYRKAHGTRHYDGDPELDGNPPTVYWQGEASAERFARSIIQKCIEEASEPPDGDIQGDTWHDGVRASVWSIKQYFGVK